MFPRVIMELPKTAERDTIVPGEFESRSPARLRPRLSGACRRPRLAWRGSGHLSPRGPAAGPYLVPRQALPAAPDTAWPGTGRQGI